MASPQSLPPHSSSEAGRPKDRRFYSDRKRSRMSFFGKFPRARSVGDEARSDAASHSESYLHTGANTPPSLYDKARDLSDRARVAAVSNERLKALGLEGDAAAAWARGETARTTAMLGQAKNILSLGQDVAGFFK